MRTFRGMMRFFGALTVAVALVNVLPGAITGDFGAHAQTGKSGGVQSGAAVLPSNFGTYGDAERTVIYSGSDLTKRSYFSYVGGTSALNGNLSIDGIMIRWFGGYGEYEYDSDDVPSVETDGNLKTANLSVGYQFFRRDWLFAGYVGISVEDVEETPADPQDGGEGGLFLAAEAATVGSQLLQISASGNYSSIDDTYWARLRVGRKFGRLIIGPEGVLLGDDEFESQRIGVFVSGLKLGKMNIEVSGGWSEVDSRGSDSIYGSLGSSFAF